MQKLPLVTTANVGSAVAALVLILGLFHINISDAAPAITDALGQAINGAIALASVIVFIVGHFQLRSQHAALLNLPKVGDEVTSVAAKSAVIAAALLVFSFGLTGCGLDGAATTTTPSGAAIAGGSATTQTATTQADLQNVALSIDNYLQTFNAAVQTQVPTAQAALTAIGHNQNTQADITLASTLLNAFTLANNAGIQANLPKPATQALVSGALSPTAATALVNQIVTANPAALTTPTAPLQGPAPATSEIISL